MKNNDIYISFVMSITSILYHLLGVGTQTVEDITGEYIWIEKWKEKSLIKLKLNT